MSDPALEEEDYTDEESMPIEAEHDIKYIDEEIEFDNYESISLMEIIQNKRLSCFAHDLMLAVQSVTIHSIYFQQS